jgi:ribonuclease R
VKNKKKLLHNLTYTVEKFISGGKYQPSTIEQIAQKLCFESDHLPYLKIILEDLIKKRKLIKKNKKYARPEVENNNVHCLLRLNQRGFGFAETIENTKYKEDIFIPKSKISDAIDGDIVEVKVNEKISSKGPEGEIVGIIKRGRSHLAGIVSFVGHNNYQVLVPILGADKTLNLTEKTKLEIGDRIVMKVNSWSSSEEQIEVNFSHKIGSVFDPKFDLIGAVEEFEIRNTFTKSLMSEVQEFGNKVKKKDLENRVNLTDLKTITIDPKTAKDFDDALSLTKSKNGDYHLGVHIADVSHYIKPNTLLDKEAYARANSIYFPEKCISMLPYELSNNLCSLRPNVIRLCVSVMIIIDKDGKLKSYEIVKSFIKSKKRFTYEDAFAILEDKKKSPFSLILKQMAELCLLLKKQRFLRGSIDFSLPDCFINISDDGTPLSIDKVEYDLSHQLVEEFMLKANELVAKHLSSLKKNAIYRIHEKPKDESIQDFLAITAQYGFKALKNPTKFELQDLFEKIKQSPHLKELSIAFIKSMKLANYSSKNVGHYGLALDYYCHFTSPIRRYSDLIIHRLLFSKDLQIEKIDIIANHCSNQERKAMKAENSVIHLKKLRLLNKKHEIEPDFVFESTVTKVKPFALFFDIPEYFLEDSILLNDLKQDYFIYNPKNNTLTGKYTNLTYRPSSILYLQIKLVDLVSKQIRWKVLKKAPKKR